MSGALSNDLSRKLLKVMSYINQSTAYNSKGKKGKKGVEPVTPTTAKVGNGSNTIDFKDASGDALKAAAAASLGAEAGLAPGPQRPPADIDDTDEYDHSIISVSFHQFSTRVTCSWDVC
jgi:hypothetical protein